MNAVRPKLAVLDDWETQWQRSPRTPELRARYDVTIFEPAIAKTALASTLAPFSHLVLNRERTALDAALIDALPDLRVVANTGTGVPHLDRAALEARSIRLLTTPGGSTAGVVEQTFALLLGVIKQIPELDAALRPGHDTWKRPVVGELAGKRFGIVGVGTIGTATGTLARAFGMHVASWSRSLTAQRAGELQFERAESLAALAARVDVISLHLRVTPETRNIVDARILAALPDGAILINTARAELVDEPALLREVASGRIRAGLDVFLREPPRRTIRCAVCAASSRRTSVG
ncbi:MAG: D-2-hydroxyacid dehydrogenase family protein [Candidatus Velthaea sp.]